MTVLILLVVALVTKSTATKVVLLASDVYILAHDPYAGVLLFLLVPVALTLAACYFKNEAREENGYHSPPGGWSGHGGGVDHRQH